VIKAIKITFSAVADSYMKFIQDSVYQKQFQSVTFYSYTNKYKVNVFVTSGVQRHRLDDAEPTLLNERVYLTG